MNVFASERVKMTEDRRSRNCIFAFADTIDKLNKANTSINTAAWRGSEVYSLGVLMATMSFTLKVRPSIRGRMKRTLPLLRYQIVSGSATNVMKTNSIIISPSSDTTFYSDTSYRTITMLLPMYLLSTHNQQPL